MKKIALLFASIGAMFALNSCLQNDVTITVKADGSGTVVEETVFGAQMSAMMGGMGGLGAEPGAAPADPLGEMFSEEKAKERAAAMGEGVTVAKVEKIDKDGKKGGRVTYAFKDVNKLKYSLGSGMDALDAMGEGMPGAEGGEEEADDSGDPVQFKMEGKKLTVILPQPDEDAKAPEIPEKAEEKSPEDLQAEQMAKAMFADMRIGVKLVIEPGIDKCDATHVEGNTITLMEMKFGELMNDPKGMGILDQMEGKSPEEMGKLIEGVKGVKFETKEKITVDVK